MGATQSQSNQPTQLSQGTRVPTSLPLFRHAIILNGLEGSGKSTVQSALKLSSTRVLEVDSRFLTTPQIYSTIRSSDGPGNGHDANNKTNDKLWSYGGRGSYYAKWSTIAEATMAIVFTIDARKRETLVARKGHRYLPNAYVDKYRQKTKEEQQEIYTTLKSQIFAVDMLKNLIEQDDYRAWNRRPVLILLTHADQPNAMTPEEVCEAMNLPALLKFHDWRLASCNALTGEGMAESIDWLNYVISAPTDFSSAISKHHKAQEEYNKKEYEKSIRLARGYVLKASPLYKENSPFELWTPTEQQKLEFVVAPLLGEDLYKEVQESVVEKESQNTTLTPVVESVEKVQQLPNKHMENEPEEGQPELTPLTLMHVQDEVMMTEKHERSTSNASSTPSSFESSTKSPPAAAAASGSEVSQSSLNSLTPQTTEDLLLSFPSCATSGSAFTSLQSTFLAIPPTTIPMEYRKKHFWSDKKEWKPVENEWQKENIHKRSRGWFLF